MSDRPDEHNHRAERADGEKQPHGFETTHWSIVLQAGDRLSSDSQQAFAKLCQAYWLPLYAYVRRRVRDQHKAEDLTQAFFARVLEKDYLHAADPTRGRFRAFLLTALKRFMANEWDKEVAQKRGGGKSPLSLDFEEGERHYRLEPSETLTPDQIFLRNWVRTLLDKVFDQLRCEFEADGKAHQFTELKAFITPCRDEVKIAEVAAQLGLTVGAVRVAAHRLRKRYRKILREEITHTVANAEEAEDEIRSLFTAFDQ
jgi:RNA polymerase sigma-70 factor (ECF subfamily)